MRHFAQAKQKTRGIRLDDDSLWFGIEDKVVTWLADVWADKHLSEKLFPRAKQAIRKSLSAE